MSIPSGPNQSLLSGVNLLYTQVKNGTEGLNWFLKNADFRNMSSVSKADSNKLLQQINALRKTSGITEEFSKLKKSNQQFQKMAQDAKEQVQSAKKAAQEAKTVTEAIKAGEWKKVGGKGGATFIKVINIATTVAAWFGTILGLANSQAIKDIVDVNENIFNAYNAEANQRLRLLSKINSRVTTLEKQTKVNDSNQQVTGLRAQQAFTNAVRARELANDALYEVRQGRVKLEAKIADTNVKYNKFVLDMGVKFAKLQVQFQTQYNNLANQLRNNTGSNGSNVNQGVIQQLQNQIVNANKLIDNLTVRVNQALRPQSPQQPQQPQINQTTINQIAQQAATIVRPEIVQIRSENQIIKINLEGFKNVQGSVNSALRSANDNLAQGLTNIAENLVNFKANVARDIETLRKTINRPELQMVDSLARSGVARLVQENVAQQREIQQLTKDLISQNKMNTEGIQKLNQVLTAVNTVGIGVVGVKAVVDGLPAATANRIKPELVPAVQTGICNSANGGCLGNGLNKNALDISDAINKSNNGLWDKINGLLNGLSVGLDAATLAKIDGIDLKLGEQLPDGGIAGKLKRSFKWLHIDRVVNLVTLWSSLHNSLMLSDNIAQTFFSILDNIIAVPQLITNPEGETINTREVFGNFIEGWMKNLLGVQEWEQLKSQWATWNRIYQSSANVVDNVRNIGSNISDSVEIAGRWTAQLGNALQDEGLISEDNWNYKPDKPQLKSGIFAKIDKFNDGLENLDNVLNSIQQVTQNIRDIAETANQIKADTNEIQTLIEQSISKATEDRDKEIAAIPSDLYTFSWEDLI